MALISEENKNEQSQTTLKISRNNKQEKKKSAKTKTKFTGKIRGSRGHEDHVYNLPSPIFAPHSPTMLSTFPIYTNFVYPVVAEWTPVIPIQNPVYNIQLPVVNPIQIVATQLFPYLNAIPPAVPLTITPIEEITDYHEPLVCGEYVLQNKNEINYGNCIVQHEISLGYEQMLGEVDYPINLSKEIIDRIVDNEAKNCVAKQNGEIGDPLEFYLTLPKELFPSARTLTVDPNPIIDVFCKISNIQKHAPWILDLEFGVPNLPITRPLPTYNVKLNSINCKNAPEAIHPGFESCDQDFKEAFLFYYDCVISTWYKGYIILNNDRSVENFQSWLLLPAQVLGMCWS